MKRALLITFCIAILFSMQNNILVVSAEETNSLDNMINNQEKSLSKQDAAMIESALEAAITTFDYYHCTMDTYTAKRSTYASLAYYLFACEYLINSSYKFTKDQLIIAGYLMFPDFNENILVELMDKGTIIKNGEMYTINPGNPDPGARIYRRDIQADEYITVDAVIKSVTGVPPVYSLYTVNATYDESVAIPGVEASGYRIVEIKNLWNYEKFYDPDSYQKLLDRLQGTWETASSYTKYMEINGNKAYFYQKTYSYEGDVSVPHYEYVDTYDFFLSPVYDDRYSFIMTIDDTNRRQYWFNEETGDVLVCRWYEPGEGMMYSGSDSFYPSDEDVNEFPLMEE